MLACGFLCLRLYLSGWYTSTPMYLHIAMFDNINVVIHGSDTNFFFGEIQCVQYIVDFAFVQQYARPRSRNSSMSVSRTSVCNINYTHGLGFSEY